MYRYVHNKAAADTNMNPNTDKKPEMAINRTAPTGIQIGLDNIINGVKKIRDKMVAVMDNPVRKRRIPMEIIGVRHRVNWCVDLGV